MAYFQPHFFPFIIIIIIIIIINNNNNDNNNFISLKTHLQRRAELLGYNLHFFEKAIY